MAEATPAGLPLVTSPVIPAPFRHGFTTRAGGVSAPPFDSLNLGLKWGDAAEGVLENRRRLLGAAGVPAIHFVRQVHGAAVVRVRAGEEPGRTAEHEADALCSDAAGVAVGVFVADCVPLLLADPRTGAFAAVHAGWRGAVAGVAAAAVAALAREIGSRPADLRVALGPAIGPCCFEVGPEVAAAFDRGVVLDRPGGRPHIDLRLALRRQIEALGVPSSQIDAVAACTRCDGDRFFSYRRDGGRTGQHVGFIGVPAGGAGGSGPRRPTAP